MRITSIRAKNLRPIKRFEVDGLSDVVVVAGQNGVGKTRLLTTLLSHLQNPANHASQISAKILATSQEERAAWGKDTLDTSQPADRSKLTATLQKNRFKRKWVSSLVNFESNRSIQVLQPLTFTFDIVSPDDEQEDWNRSFQPLHGRFSTTKQDMFKLILSQRNGIATRAIKLRESGKTEMSLDFNDPMEPFKKAFESLLAPKTFKEARVADQALIFADEAGEFDLNGLSSGEREVVAIVFDFLLHSPRNCVIVFDEPELHLHPELTLKLVRTLRTVGSNNQFIFSTHSAELISSSLENTVVFVRGSHGDENQAVVVDEDDKTHRALQLIGQSIGIVALGKRVVLIEGDQSALDKQTYSAIIKSHFSNLVLVPSGGRDTVVSFSTLREKVLNQSIWGVDFFMLCDHDAGIEGAEEEAGKPQAERRLRFLSRYHLENYFLDADTIVAGLEAILPSGHEYLNAGFVSARLNELAKRQMSYAAALQVSRHFRQLVGNLSLQPKGVEECSLDELIAKFATTVSTEKNRIGSILTEATVEQKCREIYQELQKSMQDQAWQVLVPARRILHQFCGEVQLKPGHFKKLYIDAALENEGKPFSEIIDIFRGFSVAASTH